MITHCATVSEAVCAIFDDTVAIESERSIGGGCINDTALLALSNGETLFLKRNSARFRRMFSSEADGLLALAREGGPRVPTPLAVHEGPQTQFLLMIYIKPGRPSRSHYADFGHAFATLHGHEVSADFGFETDNYIGSTPQKNPKSGCWVDFFRDYRLGYQINLARKQGLASSALVAKVETLMAKLGHYIDEPKKPSILHGDLWSGNAMADENGDAVIYDPAAYFGHYEADLAMTELFGRFPSAFYDAYNEILPLDSGYQAERKTIYGLYHILNHLNLFGSGYASSALSMVSRFV